MLVKVAFLASLVDVEGNVLQVCKARDLVELSTPKTGQLFWMPLSNNIIPKYIDKRGHIAKTNMTQQTSLHQA